MARKPTKKSRARSSPKEITADVLCTLAVKKHGENWHGSVAKALQVHRTTVMRWANDEAKGGIPYVAQVALKIHFGLK